MIQVGTPAPAFVLPDQDGLPVSLEGLRGRRVVLYFYPKDDTPGCTIEACDFSAGIGRFAALDAVVLGCSADDAESHRAFIAKHGLKIALLTDADRSVMKAYGAWGEKNLYGKTVEGVIRSTVVIDEQGVVAAYWPKVSVEGHVDAVAAKLSEMGGGAVAAPAPKAATKRAKPAAKKPVAKAATPAAKSSPAKAKAKAKPVAKAKPKAKASKSSKPASKAKAAPKAKAKPKAAAKKPAAKAAKATKKPARKVKVGAKRR